MIFQRFWPGTPNSPRIKAYKTYRTLGRDTSSAVLERYVNDAALNALGQILGIQQGKSLIFEEDREVEAIMDFLMYEYRVEGLRLIDRYWNEHPDLPEQEHVLVNAMRQNALSLFQIVQTDRVERTVLLNDLLSDRGPIEIIDLNLSRTSQQDSLIFTRVLSLGEFNMTSGLFFIFPGDAKSNLLKRHKTLMKRVKSDVETVQKFAVFFKFNRALGLRVGSAEIK